MAQAGQPQTGRGQTGRRRGSGRDVLTSRELLQALRADGQSMTAIAAALGRSPRLLRFIANGDKPGTNLTAALDDLYRSGRVRTPPARRRRPDGQIVRVRGRRGRPSVIPPTPAPPAPSTRPPSSAPSAQQPDFLPPITPEGANRLAVDHTDFPGGRTKDVVRAPRRGWNRELGNEAINDLIDGGITAGQRLQITAWVELDIAHNHQRIPVLLGGKGGYDPNNLAMQIRIEQGDALQLISDQIVEDRYAELVSGDWSLVQVELDLW